MGDKKKKPATAADIQNLLRRKALQIEVLSPPDIDAKALLQIEILRVMTPQRRRTRWQGPIFRPKCPQPILVDLCQERPARYRVQDSLRMPPGTPVSEWLAEFGDAV